ncbi:MAG: hypothetical protein EP343_06475 [Deltaproteobacteria bacterium]|nr:MAG: hypothetical protein EP343_06475 [Deltaproteobacteria bacterium]
MEKDTMEGKRPQASSWISFSLLLLGLLGYMLWPWASCPLLPSMDLPAHLALVEAMHHVGQSGSLLADKFVWGLFPAPNSMFYLLTYALSWIMPVAWAGRVIFLGAMVFLLISGVVFARAMGRSPWIAFAMLPFLGQWVLLEGFLDFYIGVAFLLLALGMLHQYLKEPTWGQATTVGVLGVLVFFSHVQAFMFYGLLGGALFVLHAVFERKLEAEPSPWSSLIQRWAVAFVPCLLAVVAWFVTSYSSLGSSTWQHNAKMLFPSYGKRLAMMFHQSILTFGTGQERVVVGLVLGLWLCRTFMYWATEREPHDWIRDSFLHLALAIVLAVFFFAPLNIGLYWNLYNRSVLLLWFLVVCALMPAGQIRSDIGGMLATLPLAVTLSVTHLQWQQSFQAWRAHTRGFSEVLHQAPKQTRLFYVVQTRKPYVGTRNTYLWRHLGHYHTLWNQGTTSYSFGLQPGRIIRERHPVPHHEAKQYGRVRDLERLELIGCFDVVLLSGTVEVEKKFPRRYSLIARKHAWSLYRVTPRGRCKTTKGNPTKRR